MIIGWQAWFVNMPKQTEILRYTSEDSCFSCLPKDGCLGIRLYEDILKPNGEEYQCCGQFKGYDWYFMAKGPKGPIYGVDVDQRTKNVPEELKERYRDPVIIRGIWTDWDTMREFNAEFNTAKWPT